MEQSVESVLAAMRGVRDSGLPPSGQPATSHQLGWQPTSSTLPSSFLHNSVARPRSSSMFTHPNDPILLAQTQASHLATHIRSRPNTHTPGTNHLPAWTFPSSSQIFPGTAGGGASARGARSSAGLVQGSRWGASLPAAPGETLPGSEYPSAPSLSMSTGSEASRNYPSQSAYPSKWNHVEPSKAGTGTDPADLNAQVAREPNGGNGGSMPVSSSANAALGNDDNEPIVIEISSREGSDPSSPRQQGEAPSGTREVIDLLHVDDTDNEVGPSGQPGPLSCPVSLQGGVLPLPPRSNLSASSKRLVSTEATTSYPPGKLPRPSLDTSQKLGQPSDHASIEERMQSYKQEIAILSSRRHEMANAIKGVAAQGKVISKEELNKHHEAEAGIVSRLVILQKQYHACKAMLPAQKLHPNAYAKSVGVSWQHPMLPVGASTSWQHPAHQPPSLGAATGSTSSRIPVSGATSSNGYQRTPPNANHQAALKAIIANLNITGEEGELEPPPNSMTMQIMRHQRMALAWMCKRETGRQPRGGILADDQGLGKTVSTISLILTHTPDHNPMAGCVEVSESGDEAEEEEEEEEEEGEEQEAALIVAEKGAAGQAEEGDMTMEHVSLDGAAATAAAPAGVGADASSNEPGTPVHANESKEQQQGTARARSCSCDPLPTSTEPTASAQTLARLGEPPSQSDQGNNMGNGAHTSASVNTSTLPAPSSRPPGCTAGSGAGASDGVKKLDSHSCPSEKPRQGSPTKPGPQGSTAGSKKRRKAAAPAGDAAEEEKEEEHGEGLAPGGTLVVCPTSVLHQWAREIRDKVNPITTGFSVHVYHGKEKKGSLGTLSRYSVVLTTYGTLATEAPAKEKEIVRIKKQGSRSAPITLLDDDDEDEVELGSSHGGKSPRSGGLLFGIKWHRIVLDEAQTIKNPRTLAARACSSLVASHRWCLSGTPIQNTVDDLYSYFKFLRYKPYSEIQSFKELIKERITANPDQGYKLLQAVLQPILLRRTKETKIQGEPVVKLPAREQEMVQRQFAPSEQEFYAHLQSEGLKLLNENKGSNQYVGMLYQLLKLRQACNHPWLVKGTGLAKFGKMAKPTASEVAAAKKLQPAVRRQLLSTLREHQSMCPVCADVPESPVVSSCNHVYCRQCVAAQLEGAGSGEVFLCSTCSQVLRISDVFPCAALEAVEGGPTSTSSESSEGDRPWVSSSKVDQLMELLETVRAKNKGTANSSSAGLSTVLAAKSKTDARLAGALRPLTPVPRPGSKVNAARPEKVIVFSQWTTMLDLLEVPLKKGKFGFRRLDGTMTVPARERSIGDFEEKQEVMVLLVSLKAAALGVNLTVANRVVLMDLWWNPTIEEQAIDRAHRIGQTRTVHVTRITIKDSVEDRILELQKRKREVVSLVLNEAGRDGTQGSSRLTMDDLHFLFGVKR